MITLKIGEAICPILSKTQTERFFGKWQTDNFGGLFCMLKIKIEQKRTLDSFLF